MKMKDEVKLMIRIQNMDAYRKDIEKLAEELYGTAIAVPDEVRSVRIKLIARSMIDLDIQRTFYRLTDKEIDDAIRVELFHYIKQLEEDSLNNDEDNLYKLLASAHECAGGCID